MPVAPTYAPASQIAAEVDSVYVFITGVAVFFFLLTQGLLIYFAVRYRRRKGEPDRETPYITSNRVLEGVWIAVPTLAVFAIFAYGFIVWYHMQRPLADAKEIQVTARQWLWVFKYPDGREEINELTVPVGQPVKLVMTSADVIHSLFIPELRMKQDVLPGRYTYMYVKPERAGSYDIYCAEYCGTGHSQMLAKLTVLEPERYREWEAAEAKETAGQIAPAERGRGLVETVGCLACHSLDGAPKVGPTFKGLFGRTVTLADGTTVTADENYIRESIYDPNARLVKGYQPIMPTFKGVLKDEDVEAVIAFLKTLAGKAPAPSPKAGEAPAPAPSMRPPAAPSAARGKEIVEKNGCLACHSTDGSVKAGPTFKGLFGRKVTLADGKTVTADEEYIEESIVDPNAKVVKGFQPIMPPFAGAISHEDLDSVVEYIKTLK